ncbi:MAG: hypothetical protein MHM6MM_001502 [Cercozoa sp. M6MM]
MAEAVCCCNRCKAHIGVMLEASPAEDDVRRVRNAVDEIAAVVRSAGGDNSALEQSYIVLQSMLNAQSLDTVSNHAEKEDETEADDKTADWSTQIKALDTLQQVAADVSQINFPLCQGCAQRALNIMQARERELKETAREFRKAAQRLQQHRDTPAEQAEFEALCREERELTQELQELLQEREALQNESLRLDKIDAEVAAVENELVRDANMCDAEATTLRHQASAADHGVKAAERQLRLLRRTDALDDLLHIDHDAHFGMINNYRLGRLPAQPVDWSEINAALGETVLLLDILARSRDLRFTKYDPVPLGSFSKMRMQGNNRLLELNVSTDFSLSRVFWTRAFNEALFALLVSVAELSEHFDGLTLAAPIDLREKTIGGIHALYRDEIEWTRAMKLLLTDMKQMVTWCARHPAHSANKLAQRGPRTRRSNV